MNTDFQGFVDALTNDEIYSDWGPALALLDIGNFASLVSFGLEKGYVFTEDDVRAFLDVWQVQDISACGVGGPAETNTYLDAWACH